MRPIELIDLLRTSLERDGVELTASFGDLHGAGRDGLRAWEVFKMMARLDAYDDVVRDGSRLTVDPDEDILQYDAGRAIRHVDERLTALEDEPDADALRTLVFSRVLTLRDDANDLADDVVVRLVLVLEPDDAWTGTPEPLTGGGGPPLGDASDDARTHGLLKSSDPRASRCCTARTFRCAAFFSRSSSIDADHRHRTTARGLRPKSVTLTVVVGLAGPPPGPQSAVVSGR